MLHVGQAVGKEIAHMFVIQGIVNIASLLLPAHQPHLAQMAQVVGNGRWLRPTRSASSPTFRFCSNRAARIRPAGIAQRAE